MKQFNNISYIVAFFHLIAFKYKSISKMTKTSVEKIV